MDSFPDGALGPEHRPQHCAAFRAHHERQAAPGDGLPLCLGIIRLAGQYSPARMEGAAERTLMMGACRYQSVKSILKNSLDRVSPVEPPPTSPPPPHDNIRGAEYFD